MFTKVPKVCFYKIQAMKAPRVSKILFDQLNQNIKGNSTMAGSAALIIRGADMLIDINGDKVRYIANTLHNGQS